MRNFCTCFIVNVWMPSRISVVVSVFLFLFAYSNAQKTRNVELLHADGMRYDKKIGENVRLLVGHVKLKHEGAIMLCDSAVQNEDSKSFDAFGNVHIIQGDTLNIFSDVLFYDGKIKMARLRRNVRMINRETILTTDKLNYNMAEDVGYYLEGGQIVDSLNVIVSETGTYYPKTDDGFFHKDVVVTTPDFKMYTDTLKYNTEIKIVSILGPTKITDDTTVLYAENGYYKSIQKFAFIYDKASVTRETHTLKGDTLVYNQKTHDTYAYNNVFLQDKEQKVIITGNYGFYNDSTKKALVHDSAIFMMYSSADTLFLHADTLRAFPDTLGNNIVKAYYGVRFFKSDMQGKCDSLTITMVDTVIHLNYDPIVWSSYNQLSGDLIKVFQKNGTAERIKLTDNAFMASMEDSTRYNQIKGKEITAFIVDSALRKIDVDGNAQSVYYTKDGPYIIGINKAESSYLIIYLLDNTVEKIIMHPQPTGKLYPNKKVVPEVQILKGFEWYRKLRPKDKFDIY